MAGKTLTRMDLSDAVFREVGLSRNESAQLVERVLELMSDSLVAGQQVKISSFGTFSVRSKTARVGRAGSAWGGELVRCAQPSVTEGLFGSRRASSRCSARGPRSRRSGRAWRSGEVG